MQTPSSSIITMISIVARLSLIALAGLLAVHAEATCLNRENTSVPESTPTSRFAIHPDGTLVAPATGLMWKRCLEGQTLSGNMCQGTPTWYTWTDALAVAQAATFAGHADWRLPNPKELMSIIEDRCAAPALNAELFPISGMFGLWKSTPTALMVLDIVDEIWLVDFDGYLVATSENQQIQVLLVRDLR
jgi:hypothetical protein